MDELNKLSFNELKELCDNFNTSMETIEDKYESGAVWDEADTTAYQKSLDDLKAVKAEIAKRPENLKDERHALNLADNVSSVSSVFASLGSKITVGKDLSDDDPKFGYKTDNEFMLDVVNCLAGNQEPSDRLKQVVINAVGSDEYSRATWKHGGVLIPEGFMSEIIRIAPEQDQLLGRMRDIPMDTPTLKITAAVDKDHSNSFTGGTRVYRVGETLTTSATRDEFEKVTLEATELVGESYVTKQLIQYSPISIPSLIQSSMDLAFQYKLRDEIITGNGQGKYLGFLQSPALISATRTASQADATILSGTDILRVRQRVWGYDNAVWVCNWDLFEHVAQAHIESPNNAGLIKVYAPPQGDVPETLLGRPIVWTEFMPGIQSGQDGNVCTEWGETATGLHYLACVNMTQYLHGMLYTDQAQSAHVRFSEREEAFQFVMSDDARPHWLTSLTPRKGITTRSPFVALINTSTA